MKVIKLFFLLFGGLHSCVIAQTAGDSTLLHLQEVVIEGNRLASFTAGNKLQKIDSASIKRFQAGTLGDLLLFNTHIFVKSYGAGNLASVSSRGTNASQTAVLWNGFNIQFPTLGQTDFSYLPVSFAEDIEVQYGGAAALFGSGATGGVIHLKSSPVFHKGLNVGISLTRGSFNSWHQSAQIRLSEKRVASSLKLFNYSAENNFPFYLGDMKVRQINAAVRQKGLMFENYFKIRNNQLLNVSLWLQDNYRQIPPAMTSRYGNLPLQVNETLESGSYRLSSEWKRSGSTATSFVRVAYFKDHISYEDTLAQMHAVTHSHSFIAEAESAVRLHQNHHINIGLNNTFNKAISNGYAGNPTRNRFAIFGSYKFSFKNNQWRTVVNLRQEFIGQELVPFTPSAGLEGRVVNHLFLKANASKTYRVPTFNDLYWNPGGNSALKPESGWSEELTLIASQRKGSISNNYISLTFFNSTLENCIMWLPSGGTWSAQNIQSVWSRGLESTVTIDKKLNTLNIRFTALYNYVVATNRKARMANDNIVGKQLIYVPVYSGQATLELIYKGFYINYLHCYTGNRYYTSDNSSVVGAYQLGNLIAGKNFKVGNSFLNVHIRGNNIWNASYQVVLNQAMPMRSVQAGVSYSYDKPKKHKNS